MSTPISLLCVEDSPDDVELIRLEFERNHYNPTITRVETGETMQGALSQNEWGAILADYSLPRFDALKALAIRQQSQPETPFIIVSGSVGEDAAVHAMKAGANDYILKHAMTRLVPAVERELRDAEVRRARRLAEEERARLLLELTEAVRVRDEFLQVASHELKTPLTSLQLQIQSLQRVLGDKDPRLTPKIAAAVRQVERMGRLVADLLNVSRITGGRLSLARETTVLNEILRDSCARLQETFAREQCTLTVDAKESLRGSFDAARIEEVLTTLLANAAKYGAGKPVDVRLIRAGSNAQLCVRDKGVGITAADQKRIFERFERAVSQHRGGGFGWGLWIARQIIEAHGGSIEVDSTPGEGSTFRVLLPIDAP
jgi:signal transduction histidine kinase